MAPPTREPHVKGHAFRSVVGAARDLHGDAFADAVLARLPAETREAFEYRRIVASGWYPTRWYVAVLAALRDEAGRRDIVRDVGRACVDADVGSVWRLVMKVASPETVFASSSRYFSNIYDPGKLTILERRPGHVLARWHECEGFSQLMWEEIVASCERLLELAGAREVRIHVRTGGADQAAGMEAEAWWSTGR